MLHAYVVQDSFDILGVTESLDAAVVLSRNRFNEYCDRKNIPYGSGGVQFPDPRSGKQASNVQQWEYRVITKSANSDDIKQNHVAWFMLMRGYTTEFQGIRLSIHRFRKFRTSMDYMALYLNHSHILQCNSCIKSEYVQCGDWTDLETKVETQFWRMIRSCDKFRLIVKEHGYKPYF